MRYVKILTIATCLATTGLISQTKIPPLVADNRGDIGIVDTKADTAVVYSARWCPPCQFMRPIWGQLRDEGYRVVYIDIDHPHKYDNKWAYQTEELVSRFAQHRPKVVPTIRFYNSNTKSFIADELEGLRTPQEIKAHLWKP